MYPEDSAGLGKLSEPELPLARKRAQAAGKMGRQVARVKGCAQACFQGVGLYPWDTRKFVFFSLRILHPVLRFS